MRVRTFTGLMFLLGVFTVVLLLSSASSKQTDNKDCRENAGTSKNIQTEAANVNIILESVFRRLPGIIQ